MESYRKFAETKYVYNIRGHDCYAFVGEWTKESSKGHTPTSPKMLCEIEALQCLAQNNRTNIPPYHETDMLLSLGPAPGSFFADAYRLKRYRWANLPASLEDEIQKEICHKSYGIIYDVAINSAGGWVVQLEKGKLYRWGGALPQELERALSEGRRRKTIIRQLYLNHQNKDDYILIFTDGTVHLSLHHGFEKSIRELIASTFSKREKLKWNFIASCHCDEHIQVQINASYYNQRGRLHLRRQNFEQALTYTREAYHLDSSSSNYRDNYSMALLAARKQDPIPEASLARFDPNNSLRNEYVFMRDRMGSVELLEERTRQMRREGEEQRLPREWTYCDTSHLIAAELPAEREARTYELEVRKDSPAELAGSLHTKESSRRMLRFWR